jgi:endonuclease/exonuclease/phosphatase family metal-dependent hydrolase
LTGAIVVATLNVRNTADRWRDRGPLLVEQLVALDPDVIALQEVRRFPDQARGIAREASRRRPDQPPWGMRTAYKTGPKRLWEGLAVLSRLPLDGDTGRLRLRGQSRVALRVTVVVPGGATLDVYDVHLADGDETVRSRQARRLLEWTDERPDRPAVLTGDFNSRLGSAPIRILTARLRSAYAEVHGTEPPRTVVGDSETGTGPVLDYVFVNDRVEVLDARVAFDQPAPDDPRRFPSDHFGLAVTIALTPPAPAPG